MSARTLTAQTAHTQADALQWASLSPEARGDLAVWLEDVQRIDRAQHGSRGSVVAAIAARRGLTGAAVRVKYDRWKKEGWQALINRRSVRDRSLPVAFEQYWLQLVESHQRAKTTVRAAHAKLRAQLDAWTREGGLPESQYAIPGYVTPPARLRSLGALPKGWDYSTLARIAAKQARRVARSYGMAAFASRATPKVRTSRVGMLPMQFVGLDDMLFDFYTLAPWTGTQGVVRPQAFHAVDYFTGVNITRAFKPVAERADGTRIGLTKREFDWFLLHLLTQHGYNKTCGTVLFGEMGTANASDHFKEALERHFAGRVMWDHAGHTGAAMRGMVYEAESKGNPRGKKIEGHFRILHELFSDLPGQIGRNRLEKPEEQKGLQRAADWFSRQLERLPAERARLLISPVLEWYSFSALAHRAIEELVNGRTDHSLGQWRQCGHVVPVLFDQMTPEARQRLAANPAAMQSLLVACSETRLMSPREAWQLHAPQHLARLKPWEAVLLMHPDDSRPVKVRPDHTIEITDREINADDALEFVATRIRTPEGLQITARPGDEFLAYLNPFASDRLLLCHASGPRAGAYIGECPEKPRVSAADREGALKQWGTIQQDMAAVLHDLQARTAPEATRRQAARAHNKRVADLSRPLTTGEHAAAARVAALNAAFEDDAAEAPEPAAAPRPNIFAGFGD